MNIKKDRAENSVVDLIDGMNNYQLKKDRQQVENGTWAIYIFTGITFLSYLIYFLIHHNNFDWLNVLINIIILVIYLFLGSYSSDKPYTAFITTICVLGLVLFLDIFYNLSGVVIKIIVIVYISMRLNAAKNVQAHRKVSKQVL